MGSPKTLAARPDELASFLRTLARHYEGPASEKIGAAADYLDHLPAPDVGVGLTRWDIYYDEKTEDPNGEWVRHEDVAPLLAAARAVPAEVVLETTAEVGERVQRNRIAGVHYPLSPVEAIVDAVQCGVACALAGMHVGSGMLDRQQAAYAALDTLTAALAASTAREKAKDEEIAGLREELANLDAAVGASPTAAWIRARASLSGRKPDKEGT